MQQFKFHYRMNDSVVSDESGIMLLSLEDAHRYAIRLISKTVNRARTAGNSLDNLHGWFVDVSVGEAEDRKLAVLFPNSRNADFYHTISRLKPVRGVAR
ncbi:hypothetical protein [Undibacter mobilis]|uniref:Uncharacterized protein n=1 Tax=Undibacter mobilis TaxID=2292256 RepID=A0A371B8U4_9BRAD|nr:hypothetical protein [Undibacter mobilis]RDV04016.1 hypothetical protein DXH78_05095 [Undibacter mobilis]